MKQEVCQVRLFRMLFVDVVDVDVDVGLLISIL